jgi:hypothetical protein
MNIDWFYIILFLWVIGWVSQIASIDATISKYSVKEPYRGAFIAAKVVLFFSWPYWMFYK